MFRSPDALLYRIPSVQQVLKSTDFGLFLAPPQPGGTVFGRQYSNACTRTLQVPCQTVRNPFGVQLRPCPPVVARICTPPVWCDQKNSGSVVRVITGLYPPIRVGVRAFIPQVGGYRVVGRDRKCYIGEFLRKLFLVGKSACIR